MEVWKIIFLSKWVICRFHVNLPGCTYYIYRSELFQWRKIQMNYYGFPYDSVFFINDKKNPKNRGRHSSPFVDHLILGSPRWTWWMNVPFTVSYLCQLWKRCETWIPLWYAKVNRAKIHIFSPTKIFVWCRNHEIFWGKTSENWRNMLNVRVFHL